MINLWGKLVNIIIPNRMKKFIASLCMMIGIASSSFAATSVVSTPVSQSVYSVQERSDRPDVIIVITDDRGVIIDIIVIKKR